MQTTKHDLLQRIAVLELEQRRISRIAEEKDRLYRNLFENSLGLMCVHDLRGFLLSINPAAARSLGYRPEDGIGRNLKDFLAPAARRLFDAYLERIRHNRTDSGLMRLSSRDGSERVWMYRNIRYDERGAQSRVLGHALDITERVRAEQAMKESELRFRTMADTAPVMIWMTDVGGNCTFLNRSWLEFRGRRPEEELARGWMNAIHPDDVDHLRRACAEANAAPGTFRAEVRLLRADGEYRWVWLQGAPRVGRDGVPKGYVGSGLDITESKRDKEALERAYRDLSVRVAERTAELQQANEQLQAEMAQRRQIEDDLLRARQMESIGLLAGGIAHDFNNVLMAIMGNISLAQMEAGPGGTVQDLLQRAEEACQRAANMTSRLLGFARGGAPVRWTASVAELVQEAVQLAADDVRCQVHLNVPAGVWPAEVDRRQIVQAIAAILRNAGRSIPEGGSIRIEARNLTVRNGAGPLQSGRYVRIAVEDTGPGISESDLTRIFNPFFTTHSTDRGLELATAYAIVTRHGGHISIDSRATSGTEFCVYLPASDKPLRAEEASKEHRMERVAARVLVMDDEETLREMTAGVLKRLGYEAHLVPEGEQALAAYQQAAAAGRPFDIVLVDLTVTTGLGGKDTMTKLRAIDPGVKAIVCSGYSDDPVMSSFREYGFQGVLPKPWTIEQMRKTLAAALEHGPQPAGDLRPRSQPESGQ